VGCCEFVVSLIGIPCEISCFKILHVFYATLEDHGNPLRGDLEVSYPSYAIRLGLQLNRSEH
jgi:hypothetical protein